MKRFSLLFKMLLVLVVGWGAPCAFMRAQVVIDAIGEAIDLSQLANGSSTEVVVRAAANSTTDPNYGFVWYRNTGSRRFLVDNTLASKEALMDKDAPTAYTFTLIKTADGNYRLQEHVTRNYLPGFTSGTNGFSSSANTHTFRAAANSDVFNLLDNAPAYSLTYTATGGFTILKANNSEFQVNNSNPILYLQFFRYFSIGEYEALQETLPALYTVDALNVLREAMQNNGTDDQKQEAINTFYASADGKEITLCNHHAYNGQGAEYMYANGNDLSTAAAPDASKAIFCVESAGGDTYRLKSLATGLYVAPTPARSGRITANKPLSEAGVYRFHHYPDPTDNFSLDCTNSTAGDAFTSIHRDSSHRIVTWSTDAAASQWTVEAAKTLNIRYEAETDIELPENVTIYYLNDEQNITPPAIDGYDVTPESVRADVGEVTFRYTLKNYTVTYNYYRLDPKEETPHYTKTYEGLHYGDPLPEPDHVLHDGLQLVKVPTGTVIGNREYSIYCHSDNYEPEPDAVLPESVNVTYRYLYGDREMMVGTPQHVANGESMPGLDQLPPFVQCNAPRGSVHYYEDTVIDLNVTFNLPFKSFESYDKITEWCNVSIAQARLLFNYNEADTYMSLTESGMKQADKYLFAFVGDPFHGYRIYNKAAGEGKILSAPTPRTGNKEGGEDYVLMRSNPVGADCNELWDIHASTANGGAFFLARRGEAMYINNRDKRLAFWTRSQDGGSSVYITSVDLTLGASTTQNAIPTGSTPTNGKIYRIYSAYNDIRGYMVSEKKPEGEETTTNGRMYLTRSKIIRDRSQMWMAVEQNAETHSFQLINLESGRYMQVGSNTNENATSVFILPTQATPTTYGICNNATGTGGGCALNTNANLPVTSWSWNSNGTGTMGSNWVFEEVEYGADGEFTLQELKDRVIGFSPYACLESGKYYRLKSDMYPTLYMSENFLSDKKVKAVALNTLANTYAAVWKIEGSTEDGFTLTNALTTHVIAQQNGWNAQYPTAASGAKTFFAVADGGSDVAAPRYTFCPNDPNGTTNAAYSLHCQAGGNVLNWNYRDDNGSLATASFWYLEEVEVPSEAQLAQIYSDILAANAAVNAINANSAEISEKLTAYFEDSACTRLQSQYQRISDASLRILMDDDALPAALQDIIVSIKNGKWDTTKDKVYNEYVGKFRIADYAPYSDRNAWNSKLRISATCYLTNPTGITVRSGEVVYLFVDEEPKAGAVLNLEIVEDTNAGSSANLGNLHKGLNVFTASTTGELFVNYKVADTEKYLERAQDLDGVWHEPDYEPIKIHIEGGTANGYWDLSRKMTAEDWDWLCNNMFPSEFLHIKGNNTLLCLLTRNCRYADHIVESMQVYDFIYTQELKYIGHDGQFDGRYKPSITIRDSYSGLFWNGSCANLAGHGIDYRSLITAGYWGICHEVAHGIQDVFNLAGLTEVTNNALVQMINHDFGVKSSRGISVKALLEYKNAGATWIDVLRSSNVTWATNHLFFQLYLYFEHAGHMPGFMGRVCDKLREWGGIHQTTQNRVIKYHEDYLMFAKACAEVSQTDLYDFFDAWGFFGYSEDSRSTHDQDRKSEHIYYIGDYGSVSLRQPSRNNAEDFQYVEDLKAYMKGLPNKAPNLLFINDRLKHDGWVVSDTCAAAKIDPSVIGQPVGYIDSWEEGDFGMFYDFGADQRGSDIELRLDPTTRVLTISGEGIVGVKLCDAAGNNRYVYNTRSTTLSAEIVEQIASGALRIVVALGDNTDLPLIGETSDLNGDGKVNIADLALLIDYAQRCRNYTPDQIDTLREKLLGK